MTDRPSADDIRAVYAADKLPADKYPDEIVDPLIGAFGRLVLTARGFALWSLQRTEKQTVRTYGALLVDFTPVQEITAVSWRTPGMAITDPSVDIDSDVLVAVNANGIDRRIGKVQGIPAPCGSVVEITYLHCLDDDEVPEDSVITCAEFVRSRAKETGGDKPRKAVPDGDAAGFSYSIPGADPSKDRWTGIPTVDTAIGAWPDHRIPGIA